MPNLPTTPTEARSVESGSLGIGALREALSEIPNDDARRAMARLIAKHGRKYTHTARILADKFGEGALDRV